MQASELFWEVPLNDLMKGIAYREEEEAYLCLVCGEKFEPGIVYPYEGVLYEASRFAQVHVSEAHGSMFDYLMGLDKKLTGLTELQKRLLKMFHDGLSDNEIVKEMEGGSTSTIRNHRFALREKMKQAKVFLALMELASDRTSKAQRLITPHKTATMVDERYAVTEQERETILRIYFKEGPDGPLSEIPRKEKRKLVVLRQLAKRFADNKKYTEKEVNALLKERHPDFATLRRYLIEYGFMDREPNGSLYWIKQ
ncbi:DUF2087 domain-containing protein [Cohnella thailandensis]|uniref:DUF2087 domain-containing protein n=1 Tax=Cohnella thailandensis TaxID=557557 RepID=A0A841SXJ8_9BACL|nr:DUF2087 domain-containing protein [Cohnella thailandensis]MBB6636963.1 DUF2087 domain-containing protein [Cohnella thailandensis]MBP1973154.1 hypothetical protein [Cohnella thailandensis]